MKRVVIALMAMILMAPCAYGMDVHTIGGTAVGVGIRNNTDMWGLAWAGVRVKQAGAFNLYAAGEYNGTLDSDTLNIGGFGGNVFGTARMTNIWDKLHIIAGAGLISNVKYDADELKSGVHYSLGAAVEVSPIATIVAIFQVVDCGIHHDGVLYVGVGFDDVWDQIIGGGSK